MSPRILNLLLLMLMVAMPAKAQEPTPDVGADDTAQVRDLARQLNSAEFSVRQNATAELLKLDAASVGLLEVELESEQKQSPNGEAVSRLRAIISQLRRKHFDDRLKALEESPSVEAAKALPEWDRFSAIAGDDADAIQVFLEILNAERPLFATRLFAPKDLSVALEKRSKSFTVMCNGRQQEAFPIATCVALMLLGSDSKTRLVRATSSNISDALDDVRFIKLLKDGQQSRILQHVTSAWMEREGIAVDRPLLFALQQELPVGRSIAHRVIESKSRNQSMYYALLCLGKLNNSDDLSVVEQLLETNDKLWPAQGESVERLLPGRKVESQFSVQTRDVALVVAIHMRGRRPANFGIDVTPSDETMFAIPSMGFENDDARNAALAAYRTAFPKAATDKGTKSDTPRGQN